MFVDVAHIHVMAGAGGAGALAFRRERGVPRGGPSGGRGGDGGNVVLVADRKLDTLLDYSYRQHYKAGRAAHGEGGNRNGAAGEDLRLPVPPGTLVRDAESGERLGELLAEGDELVVARGGRGGRGNASFASSTHRAPREWEEGKWGEKRHIELELKLIADVGLIGRPNAGKSTLLARVTAARPKIADYPFTTLVPNLGVVGLSGSRSYVIADIPGIIEGAHEGKGLGTRFLRHIERTRTLALLVPVDEDDPQTVYDELRAELRAHNAALAGVSHCVVRTKCDLANPEFSDDGEGPLAIEAPESWGQFVISAVTGTGLSEVAEGMWGRVKAEKDAEEGRTPSDPFRSDWTWTP